MQSVRRMISLKIWSKSEISNRLNRFVFVFFSLSSLASRFSKYKSTTEKWKAFFFYILNQWMEKGESKEKRSNDQMIIRFWYFVFIQRISLLVNKLMFFSLTPNIPFNSRLLFHDFMSCFHSIVTCIFDLISSVYSSDNDILFAQTIHGNWMHWTLWP